MDDAAWAELERRADGITDKLGTPIDAGIRRVVIGLWAHGITTEYSCEGHVDDGIERVFDPAFSAFSAPNVGVEATPPDPHPLDVEPTAMAPELAVQARTWRVQNYELQVRAFRLLERFYDRRIVPFHVRLQLCPTAGEWGCFSLSSPRARRSPAWSPARSRSADWPSTRRR